MMWYLIFMVLLYPTAVLSGTKLEPECSKLQLQFATQSSAFTTCLGKNTKPVRICVTCFNTYKAVNESFVNITQNPECSDVLLDSDNAMVIRRLWEAYHNMWTSALCSTCSGLTENRTHEFRNRTEDVLQCFEDHQKDDRLDLICIDCQSEYDALLKEFKTLQSYGFACADLADSMNSTAKTWSVKYNCGEIPVEYVPVLAMTISMCLVPVIFYSALWKFIPMFHNPTSYRSM